MIVAREERIFGSSKGFHMHSNAVFPRGNNFYQAVCSCDWVSTISFYEEVDLLRALHAHAVVTFQAYQEAKQ